MERETRSESVQVGPQGRVVIPAALRREWGLQAGESLVASLENGVLVFERPAQVMARVKRRFAQARRDPSVVDELLAERRQEAERENRDVP